MLLTCGELMLHKEKIKKCDWNAPRFFLQEEQYLYKKDGQGQYSNRVKIEKVDGNRAYVNSEFVFERELYYSCEFGAVAKRVDSGDRWVLETPEIEKKFMDL